MPTARNFHTGCFLSGIQGSVWRPPPPPPPAVPDALLCTSPWPLTSSAMHTPPRARTSSKASLRNPFGYWTTPFTPCKGPNREDLSELHGPLKVFKKKDRFSSLVILTIFFYAQNTFLFQSRRVVFFIALVMASSVQLGWTSAASPGQSSSILVSL